MRPSPFLLALLALSLTQPGCVSSILATRAVKAPNQQRLPRVVQDPAFAARYDRTYAQSWRVPVGPPAAELSVAVIEPGDYQLQHSLELRDVGNGRKRVLPRMEWSARPAQPAGSAGAKGTVLVLHGYLDSKENMMHWALFLAERGYRTILVDLRGHGRSTGDKIGFGAFEAHDLVLVLDDLQRRGLTQSRVGVLGVSYGASVGLLLAARDSRIATVVALEPYSNAEQAVVEFAHGAAPGQAAKISDDTFAAAVARAQKLGGFSWSDANVLAAMKRVTAPVLFYHGARDTWLSPEHSRRLFAAAPPGSRLEILPNDDHLVLSFRLAPIAGPVAAWFDAHLK